MLLVSCSGGIVGGLVYIAKRIVNIIWVIGPILAIISLIYNITMMLKNPDDEKTPKKIKNSVMALIILFFIPMFVNVTMKLTDNSISACWKSANNPMEINTSYKDPYDNGDTKKSTIYTKSDTYEKGNSAKVNGDCSKLQYCTKYITSLYNNSKLLDETIIKHNASVYYAQDTPRSWEEAINVAKAGKTIHISCNRPSQWSMRDIIGEYVDFFSYNTGGFKNYTDKMKKYTTQLKYDGSMSVKTAIQKGYIIPGDIVGTHIHTFSIYSVNQQEGSAIVFDGGHRFTSKCQDKRQCSTMFEYSASNNSSLKLYQIIRWTK